MVKIIDKIAKFITLINTKLGTLISYLIVPIFIILMIEVILRYFFNSPTVWGNESTQLMFGSYTILSGGYILIYRGHVNVDLLYSVLSVKKKAFLDILTFPLFLLFVGMIFYFGSSFANESLSTLEHTGSAWNPPLYPFKIAVPLGALMLLLQSFVKLWEDIKILVGIDNEISQ